VTRSGYYGGTIMGCNPYIVRQMKEWHLPQYLMAKMRQRKMIRTNRNSILLDPARQPINSVFCNFKMLTNIQETKRDLILHCDAGTMSVAKKCDLKGYGTI